MVNQYQKITNHLIYLFELEVYTYVVKGGVVCIGFDLLDLLSHIFCYDGPKHKIGLVGLKGIVVFVC